MNVFSCNSQSEIACLELLNNLFGSIAYIDPQAVKHNLELASGAMPAADRKIDAGLAHRLVDDFSVIFAKLVMDADFRHMFREATKIEIKLDSMDQNTVNQFRNETKVESTAGDSVAVTVDLSRYDDCVYQSLYRDFSRSFTKIRKYDALLCDLIAELSPEDKSEMGFVVSNFMYTFRAFAKNEQFRSLIIRILDIVKINLGVN